jgi:aspartate aminotransferase-like enzyme
MNAVKWAIFYPNRKAFDTKYNCLSYHLLFRYKVEVSGGLGKTANVLARVGHFGINATEKNCKKVLHVLGEALAVQRAKQ